MPRSLVVSNGSLLINFDLHYTVRDIYYPHVGLDNHSVGCTSRTGVWAAGKFAWLSDPEWQKRIAYEPDTLVTNVAATHPGLELTLAFHDAVDLSHNIFLRQVDVTNHSNVPKEVRLFFHYDLQICGTDIGGTFYYHPVLKALVAFKGRHYFLASGKAGTRLGIEHWSTGTKGPLGSSGCWRDAEDGNLDRVPVSYGSVDGIIAMRRQGIPPKGSASIFHWLAAGDRFHEIEELDALVKESGPELLINRTRHFWRAWIRKESVDVSGVPQPIQDLFRRSLLVIRAQIDNSGAIIASTDSDIVGFWRDTYAYVWGRDGSFIAEALDLAGYPHLSRRFFQFCGQVITREGYMLHKYSPDGSAASSWIAWSDREGNLQLPIQEDETALILYALWKHYEAYRDLEFIQSLYPALVQSAGTFLASYREPVTGLPAPSNDLWEERRGIHLFTTAAVWAGLIAAARFADLIADSALSRSFRVAAEEIRQATIEHFFDREAGRFVRSLEVREDGSVVRDYVVDSSIAGVFLFGMFSASDPMVESSMAAVSEALRGGAPIGGLARYENDRYAWNRANDEKVNEEGTRAPGNPWFICTLWLALYHIERAQTLSDLDPALELLDWAQAHALPSGVLAEQVDPFSGEPLNVSPLTWSHSSLVTAVIRYARKHRQLSAQG